jgi:hypothetical protein
MQVSVYPGFTVPFKVPVCISFDLQTENIEEQTQDLTVTETKINEDSKFGESVHHCDLQQEGETSNYPINQEEESDLHLLEQYSLNIDRDTNQLGPPQYFQFNTSQQWPLQLEGEADMGYSSHSACSSCQQGSQV